jgi:hypothetical protein
MNLYTAAGNVLLDLTSECHASNTTNVCPEIGHDWVSVNTSRQVSIPCCIHLCVPVKVTQQFLQYSTVQ